MVSLIIFSTICKTFKIQLPVLSLVVSFHHISLRFLYLCIGYLLTTVLISRFVASLIVRCLDMNFIILVLFSACNLIFILFILPLLTHYYYHTSIKNNIVFVHFHMLYLISGNIYLIIFVQRQPICHLEKI